ncbi:hypothetical protein L1987_09017 [Smallanthus sonchifolius]|uniref:Uncharacterized protein n=1 Tax=Smallanthus sonchifolius TaxID=185202 RepID=A0ACB9JMS0_9ASTR|nr:hypothetical protein L1987_09017 [Smallanthus sonchifolius]
MTDGHFGHYLPIPEPHPSNDLIKPGKQDVCSNSYDAGVKEEENEDSKCSFDFDLKGGSGLGLGSLSKKSDSRSDTSSVISIHSVISNSVLSDIKPNVKISFEKFMINDIPSYTPIKIETSDAFNEKSESEPYVSSNEESIEDIHLSQSFWFKVHKTTMEPKFLVVTNECDINMQPRGVYLVKKTAKQKQKTEKINQKKPHQISLSQASSS